MVVVTVCEVQSTNQTAKFGRGTRGSICVNYHCTYPANSFHFWNASVLSMSELSFNYTKTITIVPVNVTEETGNNSTNPTEYEACMHISNARIADTALIKFIIAYNINDNDYIFVNLVVKGR